ncbi:hypothetical protein MGYG_00918 [Nannizzia gypsea CBS 118893]|uniref:Mediator of RNA polymerase II transcription subunit 1 n=1 Tax=Arthroderma gypseum (strain ATCC MYA-4604 / CBS 118893) TaxID=535722 RepID=E5R2V9_ARTGP|nr:hypothetical protein MGYG_00918 [Nannizzia gypsea CBS 118893]EFQ97880.1 hypothetical protein MGYG_00918 [Nannizzia gypsea CBS 118893]
MATPAKNNTANANPGATPTQITSSPYPAPAAVPMGRPLSHISPSATRTPSHHPQQQQHLHQQQSHLGQQQQQLPASSHSQAPAHQYTPMLEDAAGFSSPSALLALGLSGITPSPGPGGVAMTGGLSMGIGMGLSMSDAMGMGMGMSLDLPMHSLPGATAKDTEAEKRRNMSEVLSMLRSRVAGRGVCREAVKRLSTLEGFECMWEKNNLSIAGNTVDLEIEFGPQDGAEADVVKDVTLRYATQDMAEGEKREAASAVLKSVLTFSADTAEEQIAAGEWKAVDAFHANLTRLARMDGLCREVNCFEAVEGVHESLQKVWDSSGTGTGMDVDMDMGTDADTHPAGRESRFWERLCWSSSVGCPTMHRGENVGLAMHYWADQRRLLAAQHTSLEEVLQADQPLKDSKGSSSRRQVYSAVIECEAGYPSLRISKGWQHETRPPAAYDALVVPVERRAPRSGKGEHVRMVPIFGQTEKKTGTGEEEKGADEVTRKKHVYSFHALEHVPGYTVRELPFSHPRQIEEAIPLLRQYALLGKLLSVFPLANTKSDSNPDENKDGEDEDEEDDEVDDEDDKEEDGDQVNNVDAAEARLNSLLSSSTNDNSNSNNNTSIDETKRISVSLRTPISSPPSLLVVFPLTPSRTASVTVEVLADGRLRVPCTNGIIESSGSDTRAAEEQQQEDDKRKEKLCGLLGRVLETCEDLGLLVESACRYAVRQSRGQPTS